MYTKNLDERIFVIISSLFENQIIRQIPISGISVKIEGWYVLWSKYIIENATRKTPKIVKKLFFFEIIFFFEKFI